MNKEVKWVFRDDAYYSHSYEQWWWDVISERYPIDLGVILKDESQITKVKEAIKLLRSLEEALRNLPETEE